MNIANAAEKVLLEDAAERDRTTARRRALLLILQHERWLTREQLIDRVEGQFGTGCFGEAAWVDTFYRDMRVVRRALRAAGFQVAYSRSLEQPGYYLRGQPAISAELARQLDGSVAEVDRAQIAVLRALSPRQRFQQGCSISNLSRQVVANRLQRRKPGLSREAALRQAVRSGSSHGR